MGDEGWSRALVASAGVPVSSVRDDDEVRALVHEARADRIALARMAALASSKHPAVREAIAARPDVTLALQSALVHDRRRGVRVSLAANVALTTPIARELLKDRDPSVLKALARSEAAPGEILEALTRHRREEVAHLARKALAARQAPEPGAPPGSGAVRELEDGARARAIEEAERRRAAAGSPVGGRVARTYAPRPAAQPRLHP